MGSAWMLSRVHTRPLEPKIAPTEAIWHCRDAWAPCSATHGRTSPTTMPPWPPANRTVVRSGQPAGLPRKAPLLTKDILRSRETDLHARGGHSRRTYQNTSGGSTGNPVRFLQDQRHWNITTAVQMRNSEWYGRSFGQPELYIWGSDIDILKGQVGLRMRVANALSQRHYFNAYLMTDANLRMLFDDLTTRRWPLIVAYTQSLYEIARLARQRGLRVVSPAQSWLRRRPCMTLCGPRSRKHSAHPYTTGTDRGNAAISLRNCRRGEDALTRFPLELLSGGRR